MYKLLALSTLFALALSCACTSGALDPGYTAPYDFGDTKAAPDTKAPADPPDTSIDTGSAATVDVPPPPDVPHWDGTPAVKAVTNEEYLPEAISIIEQATERVRLVHYELHDDATIDQVVSALNKAVDRGVDVQVLLEGDLDFNTNRVTELQINGCTARLDSGARTTHVKLIVADGVHVLIGSSNLSWSSVTKNNESNIRIDDTQVGAYFEAYADGLYADDTKTPAVTPPTGAIVEPYVDGGFRDVAVPAIKAAKDRVWVVTYGMNKDSVDQTMDLLADAKDRGADVRVLLERSSFDDHLNDMNGEASAYLKARGVEARFDSKEVITHAKLVIADDSVVAGTNNWSYGGFEANHEGGALVDDAATVEALASYFDGLWQSATP